MAYIQAVVAIGMILSPATTAGQSNPVSTDPQPKATTPEKPIKYCIDSEPFTGSNITKTECKTKAEWAKEGVNVDELKH